MRSCLPALAAVLLTAAGAPAQPGGKDRVEKSVGGALKFLASVQDGDGAWRLMSSKSPAATSLAVMAFLSAGHVPGEGPHGRRLNKAIDYVLGCQQQNGLIATAGFEMYQHGISTLMLAEVAGMTDAKTAPRVKKALEKAVTVILQAQRNTGNFKGGWRYQISSTDADMSVTGWQLLALRAAKNVGCDVPAERIEWSIGFIKRCRDTSSGGFCYMPGSNLTVPCTGTAILCLELCHKHKSDEALKAAAYLRGNPPGWNSYHFFYNVYYGSQAMFQLGGTNWDLYRKQLHKALFDQQRENGCWMGNDGFGPVYATSMSVLALTVEYRYLPIYQRGEEPADGKEK